MIYAGTNEVLNKILQVIGEGLTVPGADTDVLERLQDVIVIHFQNEAKALGEKAAQMAGQGQQPTAQGMNQGGAPMQIQPGGGSGMSGMGVPNPDELRRVLGATGQVR